MKTKLCPLRSMFDARRWVFAVPLIILLLFSVRPARAEIAQQAYLKASNTGAGDWFSEQSVGVSGNTIIIGATKEDSSATGVNGNQADNSAINSGAAYVFVHDGTNWFQQAYLKPSNTGGRVSGETYGDVFGLAAAISGDTAVVGAMNEDSDATGVNGNQSDNSATNSGAAYVFVRNGTNWSQQAYLKPSNTGAGDNFGYSVAVSGDTIAVGACYEDSSATGINGNEGDNSTANSGAVYVFVRDGINWSQQAYIKASNPDANDLFGNSVALSGETLVVGAAFENSGATGVNGNQNDNSAMNAGAAYVFVRDGTNWSQQAYLKASNSETNDQFGISVAASGDTVVIGANAEDSSAVGVNGDQNDNSASWTGAAYVFIRRGTNWSQQAYLKASNTEGPSPGESYGDLFGWTVAISGDTVVVGAALENSGAVGINGNQNDNSALDSGAAYVFVRHGTNWTQQAYLKASNTAAKDQFGYAVGVSGGTVVVGATTEDSNATGVNGDQGNNSATDSGAAYVFTGLGHGPQLNLSTEVGGRCNVRFAGHAGFTYCLERASNLDGTWEPIATNTAPASGLMECCDTNPPTGSAFYRVLQR
jgi:trimeric autotransporter adhesin